MCSLTEPSAQTALAHLFPHLLPGAAVGLLSTTVPLYVAELSPKQIRGRLVTSNQLFICIGVLYGFVADNAFKCPNNGNFCTTLETANWKWMLFW